MRGLWPSLGSVVPDPGSVTLWHYGHWGAGVAQLWDRNHGEPWRQNIRSLHVGGRRGPRRPPSLTRLHSCVSIMKSCTCFSAFVSSNLRATTATTNAVQPAPYGEEGTLGSRGHPSSKKPTLTRKGKQNGGLEKAVPGILRHPR